MTAEGQSFLLWEGDFRGDGGALEGLLAPPGLLKRSRGGLQRLEDGGRRQKEEG